MHSHKQVICVRFLSLYQMNICQNSDPAVQYNHWQGSNCCGYELLNHSKKERGDCIAFATLLQSLASPIKSSTTGYLE